MPGNEIRPIRDFGHGTVAQGVRVKVFGMGIGITLIKAAHLFMVMTVFTADLPAVFIHLGRYQFNAKLVADRFEQKTR